MRPMPLARSSRRPLARIASSVSFAAANDAGTRQVDADSESGVPVALQRLPRRPGRFGWPGYRDAARGDAADARARSPDVPSVARTRHPTVAMTIAIAASARATPALASRTRASRSSRRAVAERRRSVPAGVPTASRFGATPVPAPLRLCAVPRLRPTICRAGPNSAAVEIPPAPNPDDVNHWKDALPANDPIDKQILKLFVPAMLNFLIIPLVGAIDVFWVGRMGSAVALAAQGAANQVFQSAFWIISFVPSIIAPVVAKAAASGDTEEVQRAVGEAIFVASLVGLFGMLFLTVFQTKALGIVGVVAGSATATEAGPYIGWRALTFIPAIISTVAFAAFRGTLDVTTPMKITLASQMINLLLDPILIFGAGFIKAMGVAGAAMATSASEVTSAVLYVKTMLSRKIITLSSMFRTPSWSAIGKLMVGGAAVQMRSVAQNITFLAVMRAILTMDSTGTAAAAHTVSAQMFQLGLISVLALSTLAAILIPQRINAANAGEGGKWEAKKVADRLLMWGLMLGTVLGMVQACALPALQLFTPLQNVQEMARAPVLIGAVQMPLNGLVFVAEGLMQGHQAFARLAGGMLVSTGLMLGALRLWGNTLEGVWFCFFVFNISRLFFGLRHHLVDGPLAPAKLRASALEQKPRTEVSEVFDEAASELDATFGVSSKGEGGEGERNDALSRALRT